MPLQLPLKYQWVLKIGTLPKLLENGLKYYGVHEIKGKENNPVIMEMANRVGVSDIYTSDDEQAWCALFMFNLLIESGKPLPPVGKDKNNYLRAYTFTRYGSSVPRGEEKLGDVAVFTRKNGNHVGIVIAVTKTTIIVYGGNQSDQVGFTEIDKSRLAYCGRYYQTAAPASAVQYIMDSSGEVSTNEA